MKIWSFNPFVGRRFRSGVGSIVVGALGALPGAAGVLYWDVNGADVGSGNAGGTWDVGSSWTSDESGESATVDWVDGEEAVFSAGTDGTGTWIVTIDGTVATPVIRFRNGGNQTIAGGSLNLTPASGLQIDSSLAGDAGGNGKTISTALTGTGALNLALNGNMTPTGGGSNTHVTFSSETSDFTGDITVTSGMLDWTNDAALGAAGNKIILNGGGIIDPNRSRTLARDLEIGADGGVIRLWGSATSTISGAITGPGTIQRTDGGTLILTGDLSGFSGRFINHVGALRLADGVGLGTAEGADALTMGGGSALQGGTPDGLGSLTFGSATKGITQTGNVTYNPGAENTLTINSPITGTGNIVKPNNSGTLTLNGAISNTGVINANGGALNLNGSINTGGPLEVGSGVVVTLAGAGSIGSEDAGLRGWLSTIRIEHSGDLNVQDVQLQEGGGQAVTVNHTSGNLNVARDMRIGHWGGADSVYNISGGSVNLPDNVTAPTNEAQANLFLGIDGTGIMNISGSGVVNTSSLVINGRGDGTFSMDALNLTGGRLNIGRWGIRSGGAANRHEINLGGGVLGAWGANWSSDRTFTLTGIDGDVTINTLDAVDEETARSITLSGPVDGVGGFVKTGPGTLVLSGAKSFEGEADVQEGVLVANGSLPSAVTIGENASLAPGSAAAGTSVADLTLGGFDNTVTINGRVIMDLNGTDEELGAPVNDLVVIPGDVVFGPNSTILPQFYGGAVSGGNVYTVMMVDGERTGLPVIDPEFANNVRFTFTVLTGEPPFEGDILLEVAGNAGDLLWTGSEDSSWATNGPSNWTLDGASAKFLLADSVTFDDSGDASQPIQLVGNLGAGQTTVNSSKDYTFAGSGNIAGNGGLVKDGTGTLTLLTNNTYSGPISILGGLVVVGDGGTVGSLGGLAEVTIEEGSSLVFNRSDAQSITRPITGGGTVLSNGGNFTLNAPNNAVDIVVNSGTFFARGGGWGTSFAANRTITVNGSAVLDTITHALGGLGGAIRPDHIVINEDGAWKLNNEQQLPLVALTLTAATINGPGQVRGGGTIVTVAHETKSSVITAPLSTGNGAIVFNVEDGAVAADLLVTGDFVGGNGITKTGDGTMLITGNYTLGGTTVLNGGILAFQRTGGLVLSNTFGGTGGTLRNDATEGMTLSAASPAFAATVDANGKDLLLSSDFGAAGSTLRVSGGTTLTLGVPTVDYDLGVVAINFANGAGEALDDTTPKGPLGTTVWNSTLDPTTGGFANGSLATVVNGEGDATPLAIQWASANTWGSGSGTASEDAKIVNGYLDDGGTGASVTISGLPARGYTVYGIVSSDAGNPAGEYFSRDFNVGGTWAFGGAAAVSKPAFSTWAGAGEQWVELLPASDTRGNYWRMENRNAATLTIQGTTGTGRGSLAGIIIEGNNTPPVVGKSVVGSGIELVDGGDVTINVSGVNDYDVDGPLSAAGAETVTKTGARALNLNGESSFAGQLTVAEGTLGGNGELAGPVVVQSGALVNPGASVGTLTTGAVTFESSSGFVVEFDSAAGTADALVVNGSVTIGSGTTLAVVDLAATPGSILEGTVFTVIQATGGLTGTFQNLPAGAELMLGGLSLTVGYTSNTVTLTAGATTAGFDAWAAQIPDASQRGRNDDPDGDGFTNLQEFLFGSSPVEPGGSLTTVESDSDGLVLRWLQLQTGGSYRLMESATLDGGWLESLLPVADDADQSGLPAGYVRRRAEVPVTTPKRFLQVEGQEN